MSFAFSFFILFLGSQLKSIESAPSKCECELMTDCELKKAYEELECFANSFTCADIKNKVLEFVNSIRAVPRDKITRKRFCAAEPLVKRALRALLDECLTLQEKLDGLDALMGVLGLSPCPSLNTQIYEVDSSVWDTWIAAISQYLVQNDPTLVSSK